MQPGQSTTQNSQSNNHPMTDGQPPEPSANIQKAESPVVQADWAYREDESHTGDTLTPISWSASEYIDHEKRAGWFMSVGAVGAALAAAIYLVTRDYVNSIVIMVVVALFAASGARKPRILNYGLDNRGIHIGSKFYDYNEFRSFSIMDEGGLNSIELFQFKRFTTPITLYFPPDQEVAIINFLGSYLPREVRQHDPIDRLMRRVRF
jgi:hypothetical protein